MAIGLSVLDIVSKTMLESSSSSFRVSKQKSTSSVTAWVGRSLSSRLRWRLAGRAIWFSQSQILTWAEDCSGARLQPTLNLTTCCTATRKWSRPRRKRAIPFGQALSRSPVPEESIVRRHRWRFTGVAPIAVPATHAARCDFRRALVAVSRRGQIVEGGYRGQYRAKRRALHDAGQSSGPGVRH